jgi:hypothetical protein
MDAAVLGVRRSGTFAVTCAVLGTLLAVAVLASIPARIGARRPVSEILRADTA